MVQGDSFCCLLLICSLQLHTTNARQTVQPNYPSEHIAGITFESLQDVFQTYPVDRSNTDQTWDWFGTCDGLSGYRETTHTDSRKSPRPVLKSCYSVLKNCRYDESMGAEARFCKSDDKHRSYDYMVTNKGVTYGHHSGDEGECPSEKSEFYSQHGIYHPCLCDCESTEREADRYFSLTEVVTDPTKVVTGVRFKKVDHVFYIQIQQGNLGANKTIDGEVKWKDVKSVAKSDLLSSNVSEYYKQEGNNDNLLRFRKNDLVYAVTIEQNTVLLDELGTDPNEVLTGLRFRQVGQDLRFEIQVTPFHEYSGMLKRYASRWVYNDIDKSKRVEVKLQSPKVPSQRESMDIFSFGSKFVKFQVSDFKTDLGQTTVPLIDIKDVDLDSPWPIYGAGIFHKGSPDSAGFIALVLHL